ncbi:kinase-like domain-containing protein [Rhizophagus irregularis DAOM 181602=DAOM 197198]|nr:kinase-like domain-containing protein [Rhizophagus irregularis DAOM 181602=DAOM 197198]
MDKVSNYTRNLNKKVALKCLHNSQESIDSLINEAKKYSTKRKASQVLYGISQNPDTGDYILIQNNYRNEKIDDFTQERQLSEPSIAMGVDQEDYSFIISDKVQEELQKIVNDTNVRDIFFGRDHNDKVSSNKNQKLYIIVNNNPTEPLQMIENFPVTYIECGTFSEKIPRNIPPQKSFPLDIKEKFDSILDDQIGINFRSKYCNLIAISLDWKIVNREYVNKPAIVFYVIRKGIIPIGDDLLPKTIYGIDTDVREGFYEPTGIAYEYCREYTAYLASGYSIGICNFRAGTLGAFVKNSNDKICLLSNYHVLNSNDNSIIEHIVKQPAYMDHVGAIEEKIKETEKNLARAIDDDNIREKDRKSKEKKLLEDKLKDANEEVTEFARVIDGKRENCYIGGKFYGVDAAIASLELIDRDVRPKEFAIPDFAFEKYSLTVPQISGSISIKDIKSFDTDNNIFKVGRTTGLTKGRIPELSGIDISCDPMRNLWVYKRQLRNLGIAQMAEINDLEGRAIFQPRWLSRQILVKQTDTGSFMDEGDSGCIWFDKKGMIIALGHGVFQNTNSVIAIGSPINAVLKALNVELYLGDN